MKTFFHLASFLALAKLLFMMCQINFHSKVFSELRRGNVDYREVLNHLLRVHVQLLHAFSNFALSQIT